MAHTDRYILVAGGAGYIGGHVVRLLRRGGFRVVILDNFSNSDRAHLPSDVCVVAGSKGDQEFVSRTLDEYKPAGVIDLGGYADIWERHFTASDYYENNFVETSRFVQSIMKAGVPNYVFSSSAMVYGARKNEGISESHRRAPLTAYGRAMRACEDVVRDTLDGSETRNMILRYFSVAGAMEDLSFGQCMPNYYHIITAALNVAFGVVEKINAYGNDFDTPDGTGVTDYIHVQDLADIHILALTRLMDGNAGDIVNCSYGRGHSVLQITDAVSRISGKTIPIVFLERRGNFEGISVLDNGKLITRWGWQPNFDDLAMIVNHAYSWRKKLTDDA